jgi:2'-5' RNA ligase
MRLFIALPLPDDLRDRLAALQRGLKKARWVKPENLHLTLRFLGELDGRQAGDVDAALAALGGEAFSLGLAGLGCFGEGRNLRALWVGVEDPEPVRRLQAKVERAVQQAGIEADRRKFKPHVTLARFKRSPSPDLSGYLQSNNLFRSAPFAVTEFVLFSSFLTREGPIYRPEASYPLRWAQPRDVASLGE